MWMYTDYNIDPKQRLRFCRSARVQPCPEAPGARNGPCTYDVSSAWVLFQGISISDLSLVRGMGRLGIILLGIGECYVRFKYGLPSSRHHLSPNDSWMPLLGGLFCLGPPQYFHMGLFRPTIFPRSLDEIPEVRHVLLDCCLQEVGAVFKYTQHIINVEERTSSLRLY